MGRHPRGGSHEDASDSRRAGGVGRTRGGRGDFFGLGLVYEQDRRHAGHQCDGVSRESLIDKSDVIVVAVTNAQMVQDALDDYYDRRRAIEQRIKDKDTPVVYFEFRPDGSYRGYSFYFASGNGCGYCSGNMGITSTTKLANGRLKGSVKGSDTDRNFDLTLDLRIASDDHGAPLPADGGAPGKAYRDYHDALVKGDAKALRLVLPDEQRANLDSAIKGGKTSSYLKSLTNEHPTQSVKITKGWSSGKRGVILFDG